MDGTNGSGDSECTIIRIRRSLCRLLHGALDLAIVILNYNTAGLLRDRLQSVLASYQSAGRRLWRTTPARTAAPSLCVEFPDVHLIVNRHNVGYKAPATTLA